MKGKVKILSGLCALCLCVASILCFNVENKAVSAESVNVSTSFCLQQGATIKDGDTAAEMGLRFAINMSASEYETFKGAESTYSDVSFGILIAPIHYHSIKPLNYENVFGSGAVYDWAAADGTYNGNKVRIINMQSDILVQSAEDENTMRYYGTVVNYKTENLTTKYVAVGYMQFKESAEGATKVQMTSPYIRSVAEQAKLTIEADRDTEGKVKAAFIDKVAVTETTREMTLADTKGADVAVKNLLTDSEKATLEKYEQIGTVAWTMTKLYPDMTVNTGAAFKTSGAAEVIGDTLTDFNGTYRLNATLTKVGETTAQSILTADIDGYNSNANPEWNTIDQNALDNYTWGKIYSEYSENRKFSDAATLATDPQSNTGTYLQISKINSYTSSYTLLGIHSKAYYELYKDYTLTFDYYSKEYTVTGLTLVNGMSKVTAGWHEASIEMQHLLDNWVALVYGNNRTEGSGLITISMDNCYIGNFKLSKVIELPEIPSITRAETLQDVKAGLSGTTYALTNLLTTEEQTQYNNVAAVGEIVWTMTKLYPNMTSSALGYVEADSAAYTGDGNVDFAVNSYGVYRVKAVLTVNDTEYQIFTGDVDFYNSDEAPVWNTVSQDAIDNYSWSKTVAAWGDGKKYGEGMELATNPQEKDGTYLKLTRIDTKQSGYNVLGIHSKAYYELYRDYTLTFDYYTDGRAYISIGFTTSTSKPAIGWYTAEVAMSAILDNWVIVVYGNSNQTTAGLVTMDADSLYIGNFQIVAAQN